MSVPNFPVQKGQLQNSDRVTWNTADSLGRGATAVVYLGREKLNGSVVAVKVFHEHVSMVAGELDLLRRLKHENIIPLLYVEHEVISRRVVLVMQYCEGGSLYHMLDQPQYVHGLPEEEYLLVLKHVASGMEYLRQRGIIHRDLKPGNIMRHITEEGSSIYKLTDFGAARELHEEENFTSLYGTEEYLHPGMYERAVLRLPTGQRFDATVDLWSLGVTFYHVATGDLPFKPYGGRSNRTKMFEIVSQKASGVISGVQNFDQGPINWSYELPLTSPLSSGLRKLVVPLLAGLMETDEARVITYDAFFNAVYKINSKLTLSIFHTSSCTHLKLYLDKTDTYSTLREHIASLTEIPATEQLLLLNGKLLEEIIDPTATINSYPLHVLQATIFLYQCDMKSQEKEKLHHPDIPRVPDFVNFIEMDKDMRLAHSCCARAHLIKRYTAETVQKQEMLVEAELCLRLYLQFRLKCSGERFLTMSQLLSESKKRFETFYSMMEMIRMLLNVMKYPGTTMDDILRDRTLLTVHAKAEERTLEIVNYRTALVERLDQDEVRMKKWCARCKDTDCLSKISHHLSVIASIQSRFRRDRNVKDQMTSHDQQIHGFERQKLQDQSVSISSILQDHCYRNLDIMYTDSMNFFAALSKNLNRISKIEKNIESVIDCQQLLSTKLDKTEAKCQEIFEKVQTWVTNGDQFTYSRLLPTAPAESVPELTIAGQAKNRDEGYGGSRSAGVTYSAVQGAAVQPSLLTSASASDLSTEIRSLMQESRQIAGLVEENTELIKKFEENALHSSGSLSRNLTQKGVQN
ncbi:serine/threonine-protein kinase TBK1-like isoform X2 [Haliotis rufescens]|uniref:serine/threonine-protein kinase TBK1-like isoform X2 n=1 Tax=Haliotis rufescens TaxID=6454 RepID=UPI00201EFB07|nr:serine/threonine-protein kinase TBK1-like isoform X2 [Haliotis rufescens]